MKKHHISAFVFLVLAIAAAGVAAPPSCLCERANISQGSRRQRSTYAFGLVSALADGPGDTEVYILRAGTGQHEGSDASMLSSEEPIPTSRRDTWRPFS
jgi:hypothetical protein